MDELDLTLILCNLFWFYELWLGNSVCQNVPDIHSNMLTKYQMHKENNDHLHEDVKPIISCDGVKSHDPEETLYKDMLYAAEDGELYHDNILVSPDETQASDSRISFPSKITHLA